MHVCILRGAKFWCGWQTLGARIYVFDLYVYVSVYHILKIVQGGKLLQYAELNCNSLENFHGWTLVLCSHSLLHGPFHWKTFAIANRSAKIVKRFHRERYAIYVMCVMCTYMHVCLCVCACVCVCVCDCVCMRTCVYIDMLLCSDLGVHIDGFSAIVGTTVAVGCTKVSNKYVCTS